MKFHVEDAEKAPVLMDLVYDHLCYRILILLGFLAFFAQGLHYILFTLYIHIGPVLYQTSLFHRLLQKDTITALIFLLFEVNHTVPNDSYHF